MKYQIGNFVLDEQNRVLIKGDEQLKVRPKTLSLLLYLAHRQGQIISKEELLTNIWNDVSVEDGVIFQSVRDIRQLFDNAGIVRNHPRKGYEFTETVNQITATQVKNFSNYRIAVILLLAVSMSTIVWQVLQQLSQPHDVDAIEKQGIEYQHRILVLPIKNNVVYGEYEWLFLGGMEQLIANLGGLPESSFVYPGIQVARLVQVAGLARNFDTNEVSRLFELSGASIIIEAELFGNAADYKLVYKIHEINNIRQNVILDPSIPSALQTVSAKIADAIQQDLASPHEINKEFNDALFAKALISYETDWQTSVSFFQSYLSLDPDSVIAQIYLSKLYLWQEELDKAELQINKAKDLQPEFVHDQAQIKLIQGRIAAKREQWTISHKLFDEAADLLSGESRWFIKANIAEQQGLTSLQQGHYKKAVASFKQALDYYQITQSAIGLNATRLHLASAYLQLDDVEASRKHFQLAKSHIEQIQLEFLYSMLQNYSEILGLNDESLKERVP